MGNFRITIPNAGQVTSLSYNTVTQVLTSGYTDGSLRTTSLIGMEDNESKKIEIFPIDLLPFSGTLEEKIALYINSLGYDKLDIHSDIIIDVHDGDLPTETIYSFLVVTETHTCCLTVPANGIPETYTLPSSITIYVRESDMTNIDEPFTMYSDALATIPVTSAYLPDFTLVPADTTCIGIYDIKLHYLCTNIDLPFNIPNDYVLVVGDVAWNGDGGNRYNGAFVQLFECR